MPAGTVQPDLCLWTESKQQNETLYRRATENAPNNAAPHFILVEESSCRVTAAHVDRRQG